MLHTYLEPPEIPTLQEYSNETSKEMIQGHCIYYCIYYNKYIFNTGETDERQTILTCLEPSNSQEFFEQTQFIEQDSNEICQVKLSSTC